MSEDKGKSLAVKRVQVGLSEESLNFLKEESIRTATPISNLASIYISYYVRDEKKRRGI